MLSRTLSQNSFWLINKYIVHLLDGDHAAALLLSDLISRREYFKECNSLEPNGAFFLLNEDLERDLCLHKKKRLRITKKLVEKGFIKNWQKQATTNHGIQTINYYIVNDRAILDLLQDGGDKTTPPGGDKTIRRGCQKGPANKNKHANAYAQEEEDLDLDFEIPDLDEVDEVPAAAPNKDIPVVSKAVSTETPPPVQKLDFNEILIKWKTDYKTMIHSERKDALYILFDNLKLNGVDPTKLVPSEKRKIMSVLRPDTRPKHSDAKKYEIRCLIAERDYEEVLASYLPDLRTDTKSEPIDQDELDHQEMLRFFASREGRGNKDDN